jgi:hypothetical protein
MSNWYVLQVSGRQMVEPAGGSRLQLISRLFVDIKLYVETLLATEMDTQVSPSCTVYDLVQVRVGGAGTDVALMAYAVGVVYV